MSSKRMKHLCEMLKCIAVELYISNLCCMVKTLLHMVPVFMTHSRRWSSAMAYFVTACINTSCTAIA